MQYIYLPIATAPRTVVNMEAPTAVAARVLPPRLAETRTNAAMPNKAPEIAAQRSSLRSTRPKFLRPESSPDARAAITVELLWFPALPAVPVSIVRNMVSTMCRDNTLSKRISITELMDCKSRSVTSHQVRPRTISQNGISK